MLFSCASNETLVSKETLMPNLTGESEEIGRFRVGVNPCLEPALKIKLFKMTKKKCINTSSTQDEL